MSGLGGENIRRAGLDEFVGLVTPCQCWIPVFSEKEKKNLNTRYGCIFLCLPVSAEFFPRVHNSLYFDSISP